MTSSANRNDMELTTMTTSADAPKTIKIDVDQNENGGIVAAKVNPETAETTVRGYHTVENGNSSTNYSQVFEQFNEYRNWKTLTQGLMDVALFSANANQLRYIFEKCVVYGTAFLYTMGVLIVLSLMLQIGLGVLLLKSAQYTVCKESQRQTCFDYGQRVYMISFLITVVNVFISSFGGSAFGGSPNQFSAEMTSGTPTG